MELPIGIPRYNFDPGKGDVFYVQGKRITVKRKDGDMVHISPSVQGITAMSVSNLYQVARVPEDSRFAPYEYRQRRKSNPRRRTATRKRNAASTGKLIPAKVRVGKDGTVRVFVNPRHLPKANPTTYGTSYFTSRGAAERYYKPYGYDDVKSAVSSKIRDGEIHIGKPKLKAGQRLITLDGGKRYGITEG